MPVPDHVIRFWRDLDSCFGHVEPTWWGAVVTDERFPAIWDANYARIDVASDDLSASDIEHELVPALAAVGTEVMHVVSFDPEATGPLLAELSTRGHLLTFDLVMDLEGPPELVATDASIEELSPSTALWDRVSESMTLFGVADRAAIGQLGEIERDVMAPSGKRWFGVRDDAGTIVSLGAMIVRDGVGYLDNVATFPEARGRGLASAIATRLAYDAGIAGARHVFLLADPGAGHAARMYERLGFRGVGRLAATRGPLPAAP